MRRRSDRTSDKAVSLLSLSRKAGKLATGEFATEQAVKHGKAYLVLIAADASENTRKKFRDMCSYYDTVQSVFLSKETLGRAVGKEYLAVAAVLDRGFSDGIQRELEIQTGKENL